MTEWLVINAATHEVLAGPLNEEPAPADGRYAVVIMLGYPDTVAWSPSARGFVDLPPPAPLTRLGYQRLYTQAERIAIRGSADPVVVDLRELAALAETVDLADPDVVAGNRYLEALGLIGPGRAAVILSGRAPA